MIVERTGSGKWKWRFTRAYSVKLEAFAFNSGYLVLRDKKTNELLAVLDKSELTIFDVFQFDGATWAPDLKGGLIGFGAHDVALQLIEEYPHTFGEQVAHDAMLEVHDKTWRDWLRWAKHIYHWAVSSWPRKLYKTLN